MTDDYDDNDENAEWGECEDYDDDDWLFSDESERDDENRD